MKTLLILMLSAMICVSSHAQISKFFQPVPKPRQEHLLLLEKDVQSTSVTVSQWSWRPLTSIPVARYNFDDRSVSGTSILGALSYQHLIYNDTAQKWQSSLTLIPLALLPGIDGNQFSFSYAGGIGLLNNLVVIGAGYDFTKKSFFTLVTVGISLNN